jgi:hypothetical protein
MYTLDLECEDASHEAGVSSRVYQSKSGHNFTLGLTGNLTVGERPYTDSEIYAVKQYTGMYVGFHNGGFADYYLSDSFPLSENTTFYTALAKSKVNSSLHAYSTRTPQLIVLCRIDQRIPLKQSQPSFVDQNTGNKRSLLP